MTVQSSDVVIFQVHLWFIVLMAGAIFLAIAAAVATAIITRRMRNH